MWIQWPFLQKLGTKGQWPLDDLWPHICWGLMCDSTQGSLCPSPMKIHQSMWIQWPFLQKTWTKGHWPLDDLWPHIWGHMCDSTQGSLCPSPMKIHQSMWIHAVNLFAKTWTKGHWPLDDLWPHICWGHMCDSTQGSLCPSPMGIHQCMWIQWSIFAKITTYIHSVLHTPLLHTYTYYIQNQWSHSLFLNYVQARQKKSKDQLLFVDFWHSCVKKLCTSFSPFAIYCSYCKIWFQCNF